MNKFILWIMFLVMGSVALASILELTGFVTRDNPFSFTSQADSINFSIDLPNYLVQFISVNLSVADLNSPLVTTGGLKEGMMALWTLDNFTPISNPNNKTGGVDYTGNFNLTNISVDPIVVGRIETNGVIDEAYFTQDGDLFFNETDTTLLNTTLTISFWLRFNQDQSNQNQYFTLARFNNTQANYIIFKKITGDNNAVFGWEFREHSGTIKDIRMESPFFNVGEYKMITLVMFNNNSAYFYINHSLANFTENNTIRPRNNWNITSIGGWPNPDLSRQNSPTAFIDQVIMWNRSLNGSEIEELYNNGSGRRFINFTSNYRIKQGDESFINNSGTMPFRAVYNFSTLKFEKYVRDGCNCTTCSNVSNFCRIKLTYESNANGTTQINLINMNFTTANLAVCTDPTSSPFDYRILNITYFDESQGQQIPVNNTYNILINNFFNNTGFQGLFDTGELHGFCTDVAPENTTVNFEMSGEFLLEKPTYATRVSLFDPLAPLALSNNVGVNFSLFMILLNESSTVVFTWKDAGTFEPITGTQRVFRCDGAGNRNLVSSIPILSGQASANIELLNALYSYDVLIDGEVFSDFEDYTKCHIETETTRTFFVQTATGNEAPVGLYSIDCNVTRVSNNTVKVKWGMNPESNSTITGCMFAHRQSVRGSSLVYTNCTSSAFEIERTIPASGFDYFVQGKLFQNGFSIGCPDVVEFTNTAQGARQFGLTGLFSLFILMAGMILMFANEGPKWYPIGGILGLLLGYVLGIIAIGWIPASSLLFFVIIILTVGRRGKRA